MALKTEDIKFKGKLPAVPKTLLIYSVRGASFDDRRWVMDLLGHRLELGTLRRVETPHGLAMASKRGEVEYFHASGAVWARSGDDDSSENEERKWPGMKEVGRGASRRFVLGTALSQTLIEESRSLVGEAGLLRKEVDGIDVVLDQVAELDEKGEERRRGAGSATVRMKYVVDGVPVLGAGAKTLTFAEPVGQKAHVSGLFHAWRDVGGGHTIKMPTLEGALATSFLKDPEFNQYHKRGYNIEVSQLKFGYMALPAFVRQGYLFPVIQSEGTLRSSSGRREYFHFGRFHHALTPKQYARVGIHAAYLGG